MKKLAAYTIYLPKLMLDDTAASCTATSTVDAFRFPLASNRYPATTTYTDRIFLTASNIPRRRSSGNGVLLFQFARSLALTHWKVGERERLRERKRERRLVLFRAVSFLNK